MRGDDVALVIEEALERAQITLNAGDIIIIAHKIVSKAEGKTLRLADVAASPEAIDYAARLTKDPRKIQIVLNESREVLRAFKHPNAAEGTMICEHRLGFISANAAVDESNTAQGGEAILLPEDPDASAAQIRAALETRYNCALGVVITDTFGRPWRKGQVNVAIGVSGLPASRPEAGNVDARGRELKVTEPAFADEIAAASGLVIGKAAQTPVVLLRGLEWPVDNTARALDLLRPREEDMFR
ncbi:MAG: coenzyme F420-0:L-glutamate ligase [Pseudomonadota bacterium]